MSPLEPDSSSTLDENFALRVGSVAGERLLGWFLLAGAVAAAGLSILPDAVTRFYTWPVILYWHVILALPLLVFVLGAAARRPFPRLGLALDLGAFLWAAGMLAAGWFSAHRPVSVPAALLPVASVTLAYVIRGWLGFDPELSRHRARAAFNVIAILAAVWLIASWGAWIVRDVVPAMRDGMGWWQALTVRNGQPLGHPNYVAGFLVLVLPVFVGCAATSRGCGRTLWMGCTILAAVLVLTTRSWGGAAGVFALLAAGLVFALTRAGVPRRTVVMGLAAGALLGAFLVIRWLGALADPAAGEVPHENLQQHLAIVRTGLEIGRDRPWLGQGPGTVSLVYPEFRVSTAGAVENVLELHSTPVQVWAEQGVVGLLALGALVSGVAMRAWRLRAGGSAAESGTSADRARAWSLVLALTGYSVFALTDHQLDVPLFAGLIAAMLALLSALTRPAGLAAVTWSPTFVRIMPASAVVAAAVLIAWHAGPDLRARAAFFTGMLRLEKGDAGGFRIGVARARAAAPWEPFYLNQLAFHHLDAAEQETDPKRKATVRGLAVGALQQSLAVRPRQELCHLNLGWLELETGNPVAAAAHFRAAAEIVPERGGVYLGLALALLRQNRVTDAVRAFALEWINDPRAITHSAWSQPELSPHRGAVIRMADQMLGELIAGSTNQGLQQQAAYLRALLAWWSQPTPAAAERARGAATTEAQRDFFAHVHETPTGMPADNLPAWRVAQRAWHASNPAEELRTLPNRWDAWQEALAARMTTRRESFASFITSPIESREGLVRPIRPERIAYGMLARNSDGLRIKDLTEREENAVTALLPSSLFPAKGWPTPAMLVWWLEDLPD